MDSTFIASRTDDNDTNPGQQSPRKRPTDSASTFVLGNRANQQEQRYTTTTSFNRGNDTDYDVELLKHLSNDFAELLNRTDISDCFLNVKGKLHSI
jgi:hypothetical protein